MKTTPPDWAIRTEADRLALAQGYYWDQSKANSIVRFANTCFRSQYIRGNFTLLEWQKRLLQSLWGWRHPTGARRFRMANLHASKKNGKTLLTAIVATFELFCSDSPSSLTLCSAASKENASQIFSECAYTLRETAVYDKSKRILSGEETSDLRYYAEVHESDRHRPDS